MEPILKGRTTLAIILGASAFPKSPDLSAPPSFRQSAQDFRAYLRGPFQLPEENLADYFDRPDLPGQLLEELEQFIDTRKKAAGATDLIFYYVGHGGETSGARQFYLATRSTRANAESSTSLISADLSSTLNRAGSGLRFYIVLDCCFSAAAYRDFQAAPLEAATIQTREALPPKGTVLFCAASRRDVALAPAGEQYTRFSAALLTALREGDPQADEYLSFADLGRRVEAILRERHRQDSARPQLQAPNAREGDIAGLTSFPNFAWRAAAPQYEYFIRFVRRYGVPEGVGPISAEQARARERSARITREKGRVRRLEMINGWGFPTSGFYSAGYLRAARGGAEAQSAECRWDFSYDESGRVAVEEVFNAAGRVIFRCAYSTAGGGVAVAHYFLGPSDIVHPQTKSGAAFVRISRDENGFDRRMEYFDGTDHRQPDDSGSFGREAELNSMGLETGVTQLGRDLKPALCKEGYAIARYAYDNAGNLTSQSHFDVDGAAVLHQEGYHKAVFDWSPQGNWSGVKLFDVDGQAVMCKAGFAAWTMAYDEHGNAVRQDFFDAASNRVVVKEGYASWVADYDERGRIAVERCLDPEGRPAPSREGVVQWAIRRNDAESAEEIEFRGETGLAPNRSNIARLVRRYDSAGNVAEERYFAPDGSAVRNTDGVAGLRATYDAEGNQIELVYLGPDGAPSWDNEGIARIAMSYDDRRNLTERCYFEPDGAPAEDKNGHHRIAYAYDEHSNLVSTSYFDAAGTPALMEGYAIVTAHYDENAGALIRREYRGRDGTLTPHPDGYAIEELSYDRFGRRIGQRYCGIDGAPIRIAAGYAGWKAVYDARGNMVRRTYLDIAGRPAAPVQECAAWEASYDHRGNCVAMRYLDGEGKTALNADGVAGWKVQYDQRDNPIRTAYLPRDGEIAWHREGFAGWAGTYDRFGNKLEELYLDGDGAPIARGDGIAKLTWTYNSLQKRTSEQYWDINGRPALCRQGYAGWRARYDGRGNLVEQTFHDQAAKPVDNRDGFARMELDYDERGRPTARRWFGSKGEFGRHIEYGAGGERIETSAEDRARVVRVFDRSGNQIREEYFAPDGARTSHLEKKLAFSWWEAEYDGYGRLAEQRYYDAGGRMFQRLRKTFDPVGREVENAVEQVKDGLREITRTALNPQGSEVETRLLDEAGNPAADRFGRARWVEHYDPQGNRVAVSYFDAAGAAAPYRGHIDCAARYDPTSRLVEATYQIFLGEDEILRKRFRFGPDQGREVHFESAGKDGTRTHNDAYVLEYSMRAGDELRYTVSVENLSGGAPAATQVRMRQRCLEVGSDGSYSVVVDVLAPGADWQANPMSQVRTRMARNGRILESSGAPGFSPPPFPTHPIFVGETWEKEIVLDLPNPFTAQTEPFAMEYTYELTEVRAAQEGLIGQISVTCPKTEFGMGFGATTTISAHGVTRFDVHRGVMVGSDIESVAVTKSGSQEATEHLKISVVLEPP